MREVTRGGEDSIGNGTENGIEDSFNLNNFIHQIFRLVFRAALLLAGLVLVGSLLVVAALLLGLWLVRALWARLTGQPVAPWVFRVDPRAQWNRFKRASGSREQDIGRAARAGSRPGYGDITDVSDVTDVVAREIEPHHPSKDQAQDRRL